MLLAQLRGVPYLTPEEAIDLTPLTERGLATVPEVDDEDLALAVALINIEVARREDQYASLELLHALIAGMCGSLGERVAALDGQDFVVAASCLLTLGWLDHD
jgi:hypothetical protein